MDGVVTMLQQYKRILVAVDGSDESEAAFRKAVHVANRNQSSLFLLHVIDTMSFQSVSGYEGLITENVTDQVKETLEEYKKYAELQGVEEFQYLIEYGSPKILIAKYVPKEYQVDLIMLGATGLNAVERLFVGSVSRYVIQNASCDVLVVRTDLENQPIQF